MIVGHSKNKTDTAYNNIKKMNSPFDCKTTPKVAALATDVSVTHEVFDMVDQTVKQLGGLDIAVN
eukprot:UN01175